MPPQQPSVPQAYSVKEFSLLTGLPEQTVRRYLANGRIPRYQPGGRRCRVLIPSYALTAFFCPAKEPTVQHARPNKHTTKRPGPAPRWMT